MITLRYREGESASQREEVRGEQKHARNTTTYVQEAHESRDAGAGEDDHPDMAGPPGFVSTQCSDNTTLIYTSR